MKIRIPSISRRRRGVVLILTVLFLVFVAVFLASYLFLAQGEYLAVTRSQTWNTSLVLAEAGLEDALAFINQKVGIYGSITNWPTSASGQGWAIADTTADYQVFLLSSRSPDTNLGYYSVYVTNFFNNPTNGPAILSIGTARWNDTAGPQVGGSNVMLRFQGDPVRKIYARTLAHSQLGGGIIAYSGMDFKGNKVMIDSFDSTTNTHSIWQTTWRYHGNFYGYWAPSLSTDTNLVPHRTDNVMVATDTGIINVGNANIAGYVATGPGGTVEVGKNGSVGTLYWAYHHTGLQPGRAQDDVNRSFYSYQLPIPTNAAQSTWWPVPAITTNIGEVIYDRMITNKLANSNLVYYAADNLSGVKTLINASNVVLYLTNGMNLTSQGQFDVNTNADVQLWTTGDISTKGNGSINNGCLNAHALTIFDVEGKKVTLTMGGNGAGTALIYAPSSDLSFSGGGNNTYDVVGAIFCNHIDINGKYNFHFDESLAKNLPVDQFTITTWQEVQ